MPVQIANKVVYDNLESHTYLLLQPTFVCAVLHGELNDELNSQSLPFIPFLGIFIMLFYTLYML